MSHPYNHPQDMSTYLVSNGNQQPGSAPLSDSHIATIQWLVQQQSEKQSPHPSSPGIMIHSPFSSSQDDILAHDYTFTQESTDEHVSWHTIPPQMYSTGALQIHLNGSAPRMPPPSIYPVNDWNNYPSYGSPNETNSGSPNFMMNNYSPTSNNSLSPFSMPPRASSSLPQVSPTSSDHSLSPLYSSRFSTPTTPASASQPLMPSPTLSQVDHMLQQDSQVMTPDPNRPLYTHREQLGLFREALSLPREGAGPFIPQPMYKPHTTSDRKRYVEDVLLEAPIYFIVEHNQYGISLHDALHSRVKNLAEREQVVFEGRGPSVSIRLEWPGYRQWSRQIPTKDFRSPPGPITIAKLAKNVAKCVQRFMQDRKSLAVEDGSDDRWRVGDGSDHIKLEDLMLVSIHHVSLGSWQPHLRLRQPRSNIPIQSSPLDVRQPTSLLYSNSNIDWTT